MKTSTKPAIIALGAFALPAVLASSLWLGPDAEAQNEPGQRHERPSFPLNLGELEARSLEHFARFDDNNDGLITAAEFAANAKQHFKGKRHRKGGKHHKWPRHSEADRSAIKSELFALLDTDKNGELSDSEFARSREVRKTMHQQKRIEHQFAKLDANNDAQLTLAEFQHRLEKMRALDIDANGLISKEEMRAGREARKAEHSARDNQTKS